jgi:predicted dehydrogenase
MSAARAAVAGVGRMGRRHIQALQSAGLEVAAYADIDEANLAEAGRLIPAARAYHNVAALLDAERLDLVSIATTSPAHAPIAIDAAKKKVPRIFCEKPLSTSIESGRALVEACRAAGTRLVVNHSRRLFGPYLRVHDAIANGGFGDLRYMRVVCGASGIANIGTHAFDLMRWFLGPATAVVGYVDQASGVHSRGAGFRDQGGHGLVEFGDGRRATFDFTADFPASFAVEFGCRYGRIAVREQQREIEAVARTGDARSAPLGDYSAASERVPMVFDERVDIVAMTAAMIRHAMSAESPVCSGEDALGALEIAAAIHVSSQDGHRRVVLPLDDDREVLAAIA